MTIVLAVRRPKFVMIAADSRNNFTRGKHVERSGSVSKIAVHPRFPVAVAVGGTNLGILPVDRELEEALSLLQSRPASLEELAEPFVRLFARAPLSGPRVAGNEVRLVLALHDGKAPLLGLLSLGVASPLLRHAPRRVALLPHQDFAPIYGPPARWACGRGGRNRARQRLYGAAAAGIHLERTLIGLEERQCTCAFPIRVASVDGRGARFI